MNGLKIFFGSALFFCISASAVSAQNYKIRQTTSIQGQNMSSTVYVKGSRKRTESSGMMGMGADVATIEQCDLKRTVSVNDKMRKYYSESMVSPEAPSTPIAKGPAPVKTKTTKGGTITQSIAVNDTGERKQVFGLTARHVKTTMSTQASPDACDKDSMSMTMDAWYVDLPSFSCPISVPRNPMGQQSGSSGGCQDNIVLKMSGSGKPGFPIEMTQTMKMGNDPDDPTFTQTMSTIEFSKSALDDSLFNVPAGYTQANAQQDLYGRPSFSSMMNAGMNSGDDDKPSRSSNGSQATQPNRMPSSTGMSSPGARRAGVKRIGVLPPTNRGETVSITNLQTYLAQKLTSGGYEGVAVSSEADAKAAGCDYVISSDFSKLKQSVAGKIGGMFGKITNSGGGSPYDAQVDYRVIKLSSGESVMQNKASAKQDTNVDRAAETVLGMAAQSIISSGLK